MKLAFRIIALTVVAGLIVLAAGSYALGIASYERYSGYFAPVWDDTFKGVYFTQRDTSGFIWGAGWEHFTSPASSYITSDEFSIRHLNTKTGKIEVLQSWYGSPLVDRVTKHYRNRIFNPLSARVEASDGTVDFVMRLQIPKVPRSETWTLAGTWRRGKPSPARWEQKWRHSGHTSDRVLVDDVEVIAVRGREAFPAAIVSVAGDGSYKVLVQNDDFADLYPDGISARDIEGRSRRRSIEQARTYKQTRAELIAKHKAAGLSEGDARLKASDDMEELGLIPKRPRIVAKEITANPDNLKSFDIPADYFTVGLFTDIANAIANQGKLVDTDNGSYLKYYDDETGPRLKAWRAGGNDRFVVRSGGKMYLLEVRRFN